LKKKVVMDDDDNNNNVMVVVQGVLQFSEYLLMCRLKSKSPFCKASPKEYSTKNYRCTKIKY